MKKYIWKILLGILVISAISIFVLIYTGAIEIGFDDKGNFEIIINNEDEVLDTYAQVIEATKTTYPTDIFVYGADCNFRQEAVYISIDSISEDALKSNKDYKILIINDMYGKVQLSDEDFEVINKYVIEGDYAFMYIGTQYLQKFIDKGFVKDEFTDIEMGVAIRHVNGTTIQTSGFWDVESQGYYDEGSKELLGQIIYIYIRKVINEV